MQPAVSQSIAGPRVATPTVSDPLADLERRIAERTVTTGVIGLGYVGLPLACTIAEAGLRAVGFDVDPDKISNLREGSSYLEHIPSQRIESLLSPAPDAVALARNGFGPGFLPSPDMSRLDACDVLLICVPTPLRDGRDPDLSYVTSTVRVIARSLRPGQLVVLESTTYPGTTDEVVGPILEESGLIAGIDFALAFSPEREDPGNPDFTTRTIPKVVGGVTPRSGQIATSFYRAFLESVIHVEDARVAEATKILENVFRCVNIALVNELKMLFERMGIDVWEVIQGASTKPFGFMRFDPGPGLGGHCIPVDPFYLSWKAREVDFSTRFIELAGEINRDMPYYVVDRVARALEERGRCLRGARILLLGVAYKRDVNDLRESPALRLLQILESRGADVAYHDPHVPSLASRRLRGYGTIDLESVALEDQELAKADCVLVATDHSAFDWQRIVSASRLVVDTRNATAEVREGREKIVKA